MKKQFLLVSAVFSFLVVTPILAAQADNNSADTYRLLNLFGDVFERVRSDYVEEATDEKLIEAAHL